MMNNKSTTLPTLAFQGGTKAMTLTPVVGTPKRAAPVRGPVNRITRAFRNEQMNTSDRMSKGE